MKININARIKVKLTPHGERIHFDHYYRLLKDKYPLRECLPKQDADGYTQYQIWEFANIFGPYIYNGAEQVIVENEMVLMDVKRYTPWEVDSALVVHGQNDKKFKLGETIKYSPTEVRKILLGEM